MTVLRSEDMDFDEICDEVGVDGMGMLVDLPKVFDNYTLEQAIEDVYGSEPNLDDLSDLDDRVYDIIAAAVRHSSPLDRDDLMAIGLTPQEAAMHDIPVALDLDDPDEPTVRIDHPDQMMLAI